MEILSQDNNWTALLHTGKVEELLVQEADPPRPPFVLYMKKGTCFINFINVAQHNNSNKALFLQCFPKIKLAKYTSCVSITVENV